MLRRDLCSLPLLQYVQDQARDRKFGRGGLNKCTRISPSPPNVGCGFLDQRVYKGGGVRLLQAVQGSRKNTTTDPPRMIRCSSLDLENAVFLEVPRFYIHRGLAPQPRLIPRLESRNFELPRAVIPCLSVGEDGTSGVFWSRVTSQLRLRVRRKRGHGGVREREGINAVDRSASRMSVSRMALLL